MKSLRFFLLMGAVCSSFAASKTQNANSECCPKSEPPPCCRVTKQPLTVYEICQPSGWNVGVRGDVLYMFYSVPVLTYASEQTTTGTVLHSNILSVPDEGSVGCDIALNYTLAGTSGFVFEAGWFHINPQFSDSKTDPNLLPAHIVSLAVATPGNGSVSADLHINFIDLILKKKFYVGEWFSVTPAAGLVGGYMDGKSRARFNATSGAFSSDTRPAGTEVVTTIASLDYNTDYKGIGIKIGAASSFEFCYGFRLNADIYYNALYGYAKSTLDFEQNGLFLGLNTVTATYRQHHGRDFVDSLLGLGWDYTFCNDIALDIHAGWRFQFFPDGWKEFEAVFNDSLHELSLSGQGLQAGASITF